MTRESLSGAERFANASVNYKMFMRECAAVMKLPRKERKVAKERIALLADETVAGFKQITFESRREIVNEGLISVTPGRTNLSIMHFAGQQLTEAYKRLETPKQS